MNATSIKTATSSNTISGEIKKIIQPKNKIIERLQAQVKSDFGDDTIDAYSRMHNRHNRSHTRS